MTEGIRSVEILDLEESIKVINNGFMTVAVEFGLTRENCATNGAFMSLDRLKEDYKKGNLMFGYYIQDVLVGFAEISHMKEKQYSLEKITVLPNYRHHGIGKKLLEHAIGLVEQLGGEEILIGVINENTILKSWYEKHGFVVLGTKIFEHLPFTVCFMRLLIKHEQ